MSTNDVSTSPPGASAWRYMSVNPSQGAMAARCGGRAAATNHCATASHELPARPTRPFDQACAAAQSTTSNASSPSSRPKNQMSPSDPNAPRASGFTTAYPWLHQIRGVRTLPLLQPRDRGPGHATPAREVVEHSHTRSFSVRAPRDQGRKASPTGRPVDVGVDHRSVAQAYRDIAFADHLAREGQRSLFDGSS
jgi:hypothetical protein